MALQLVHPLTLPSHSNFIFFYNNHHRITFESCGRINLMGKFRSRKNSNNSLLRWRTKSSKEDIEMLDEDISAEDLQYVEEIKRVLGLLKRNRDMLFNEVKLTIMIEDPREVERRELLDYEDDDSPTREDLAEALEQVNEGKVPKNRVALKMLAEEMVAWPNLEVEPPKQKPKKSLYAKVTDTGVDPEEAAQRLKL